MSIFLSNCFHLRGEYDQALTYAQRALTLATASGDVALQVGANAFLAMPYIVQGAYQRVIDISRRAMASLEGPRRWEHFGQVVPPAVLSRAHLVWCLAEVGAFAEGSTIGEEGLWIAEAVNHPASLMYAYWGVGSLYFRKGDVHQALLPLERALGICQGMDFSGYFPLAATLLVLTR